MAIFIGSAVLGAHWVDTDLRTLVDIPTPIERVDGNGDNPTLWVQEDYYYIGWGAWGTEVVCKDWEGGTLWTFDGFTVTQGVHGVKGICESGGFVYVAVRPASGDNIFKLDLDGNLIDSFELATNTGGLDPHPQGVVVHGNPIRLLDFDLTELWNATPAAWTTGSRIDVDGEGNVYYSDSSTRMLHKIDSETGAVDDDGEWPFVGGGSDSVMWQPHWDSGTNALFLAPRQDHDGDGRDICRLNMDGTLNWATNLFASYDRPPKDSGATWEYGIQGGWAARMHQGKLWVAALDRQDFSGYEHPALAVLDPETGQPEPISDTEYGHLTFTNSDADAMVRPTWEAFFEALPVTPPRRKLAYADDVDQLLADLDTRVSALE